MRLPNYERLRQTLYEREILAKGYAEERNKMMNVMPELMRKNSLTPEQLDPIKAAALNS